ncbi:MAG: PilZ domain-containing protein [Pseudomonadota bacterium]
MPFPAVTTLELGQLALTADEDRICFELGGSSHWLDARDVATLERFLAEHRSGESRTGFRVPVYRLRAELQDAFQLTLVHHDRIYDAVPIDLSLTGLLVRAPGLEAPVRSAVVVRLILEDRLAKIDAQVTRVDGDLLALHFTESMAAGELCPPAALGPIFGHLEQLYLRRRSASG